MCGSRAKRYGSSPRPRGTRRWRLCDADRRRFIPASAGNTRWFWLTSLCPAVHPRVRGEHLSQFAARFIRRGSSPRPRGTLAATCPCRSGPRFIPASAGNTRPAATAPAHNAVHPRVRGEHIAVKRNVLVSTGSSPRPRGTRPVPATNRRADRFIPASAGNTQAVLFSAWRPSVHPRVRGEHELLGEQHVRVLGSSPRPRGTPLVSTVFLLSRRFIPASAGNTTRNSMKIARASVHPRVRGEHSKNSQLITKDYFAPGKSTNFLPCPRPASNHPRL